MIVRKRACVAALHMYDMVWGDRRKYNGQALSYKGSVHTASVCIPPIQLSFCILRRQRLVRLHPRRMTPLVSGLIQ
jgi:hypothetical protein